MTPHSWELTKASISPTNCDDHGSRRGKGSPFMLCRDRIHGHRWSSQIRHRNTVLMTVFGRLLT